MCIRSVDWAAGRFSRNPGNAGAGFLRPHQHPQSLVVRQLGLLRAVLLRRWIRCDACVCFKHFRPASDAGHVRRDTDGLVVRWHRWSATHRTIEGPILHQCPPLRLQCLRRHPHARLRALSAPATLPPHEPQAFDLTFSTKRRLLVITYVATFFI